MKKCNKCGVEKEIDNFGVSKKKLTDGTIKEYQRNTCNQCLYGSKNTKVKVGKKEFTKKENTTLENKNPNYLEFSQLDIRELKEFLRERRDLKQYKNLEDKTKRVVKAFNIDNKLYDKLQKYSKTNKIGVSDALNILLTNAFRDSI